MTAAEKAAAPKLIDAICRIRFCDEAARYNIVLNGHPNGDVAYSYCAEHARERGALGHWDESPAPYSITITGPIWECAK